MKHVKAISKLALQSSQRPAAAQDGDSVQILSIAIIVLQALIAISDAKAEAEPQ